MNFLPEVQAYYKEEGLDNRILLLLDNAPGHPKDLGENITGCEVMYMPPDQIRVSFEHLSVPISHNS